MHEHALLGLDVGTTNIKAVLFDVGGRTLRVSSRSTPTEDGRAGEAVHHADALWRVVCEVTRDAVEPVGGKVAGVAVASMGEEGFPLDSALTPLYPGIAWHDARTVPQAERWRRLSDPERVYDICGLTPHHSYTVHKLAWLKEREPDLWSRTRYWAAVSDFIALRLSDTLKTDLSQASRTSLLNLRRRAWSTELIELAGITPELLPAVVQSGTRIGQVTRHAAKETGLQSGVPVATGGHDHICGALAVGAVFPGSMLHSGGTAEGLVCPLDRVALDPAVMQAGISFGCHVAPGLYYAQGMRHSGGVMRWLVSIVGQGDDKSAESVFMRLADEASSSPPGARGVSFLPYLYGKWPPDGNPEACGAFLGLKAYHTRADLARAVFEAISYDVRRLADVLRCDLRLPVASVTAIGGLARARVWCDIKAALLNLPVTLVETPEAVALGAAALAGLAVGLYPDAATAVRMVRPPIEVLTPERDLADTYEALYLRWRALDEAANVAGALSQGPGTES